MDVVTALRQNMHTDPPLLAAGDHVLAAVSGGPDSLALLHALHTGYSELGLAGLSAAHFHHGLRGTDADEDAAFVQSFCAERGIPCMVEQVDIGAWAQRTHVSIQQAARTARYAFLEQTAEALGANKIATAHTQDDQIETVLLNILRGTGLDGLRGIPSRRGLLIRPLLDVPRAQTVAYCATHGLHPRQDSSNNDPSHYTRNRVRLELLPLLEREYHPGVRGAILRLSQVAEADADYLQTQARAPLAEATISRDVFCHVLSVPMLAGLHPALLRAVLRMVLSELRGSGEGLSFSHVERLRDAILTLPADGVFVLTLPAPLCTARVTATTLTLSLATVPRSWADVSAPLSVPGEAVLSEIGWTVRAAYVPATTTPDGSYHAALDAALVDRDTLVARNWRMGDRIDPLGLGGHTKKAQDIFTDAKTPRAERCRVPLVADKNGLLWIAGLAVSERARVSAATRRPLLLSAHPLPLS